MLNDEYDGLDSSCYMWLNVTLPSNIYIPVTVSVFGSKSYLMIWPLMIIICYRLWRKIEFYCMTHWHETIIIVHLPMSSFIKFGYDQIVIDLQDLAMINKWHMDCNTIY